MASDVLRWRSCIQHEWLSERFDSNQTPAGRQGCGDGCMCLQSVQDGSHEPGEGVAACLNMALVSDHVYAHRTPVGTVDSTQIAVEQVVLKAAVGTCMGHGQPVRFGKSPTCSATQSESRHYSFPGMRPNR